MPSLFPGMNPYLEQDDVWRDFHKRFIARVAEMLNSVVQEGYFVKLLDRWDESYIEVREPRTNRAVSVLELLSPESKRSGKNHERYAAWRKATLTSDAQFVEFDLLRGGGRFVNLDSPSLDYCVLVNRARLRPNAEIWPIRLRDRLPMVPIPLREPDCDAALDLQSALDRTYDAAGYAKFIYEGDPDPPLNADDAAWARQFLPNGA